MPDRQVKIDILADEKGFTKGVGNASTSTSKFENALKKLGPVGSGIQTVLDKIGLSSLTSAAGLSGGLTAAIGISVAMVEKGVAVYTQLGEKIRNYSVVTGEAADMASRQVQVFTELGVSEEDAATSMAHLAREAANAPKKLADVGVEVAKDAKGNVDLNQTLLNLIDKYQGTADAGQRAALVFAAFGKGGQALLPVLETNAAELAKLEAQVKMVYTDKDLEQIRQYGIQQQILKQQTEAFWANFGKTVFPNQLNFVLGLNAATDSSERIVEAQQKAGTQVGFYGHAMGRATMALQEQYIASTEAKAKLDDLTASTKAAAAAALEEADAERAAADAIRKSKDAQFAYEQAQLDLDAAIKRVKDTKGKDHQANLNLRESYIKLAYAALTLKEGQAEASGSTLTQAQQTDVLVGSLQRMEKGLGKNSPLRRELDAYIAQLKSIPGNVNTNITATHKNVTQSTGKSGTRSFDAGGMVPGPPGSAQAAIVHGGEMVLTPDQQKVLGSGAGGRGGDVHNHWHIGMVIAPPGGMDWLANELLRRARYAPGR